jgi:hypothetical protein
MKYETPQITELTPAISAIQAGHKQTSGTLDVDIFNEGTGAYADWE